MAILLRHWWREMRSSFWFMPSGMVLGAVALAAGLIQVDTKIELNLVDRWPLLFGAGADGARGLLAAVATSMITVAGVVFSITIVALSLTASQYSSRVLRYFMRDSVTQMVLGVFVGVFAYCLVVLRTINGSDERVFVPSLAVLAGLFLAFVGIAYLIYFIHHIALSIQASTIIANVASETLAAVDHLFPDDEGEPVDEVADASACPSIAKIKWSNVAAQHMGYIESVDADSLLKFAGDHDTLIRMERGIGDFLIEGAPLVSLAQPCEPDEATAAKLNSAYIVSRQRTVRQDAGFGIRQIVDIAMKALSPGINDSTTAVMCVDYLTAILLRLAGRDIPDPYRLHHGQLRLIARGPTFDSLMADAFDEIRQNAEGNVAVLSRMIDALEVVASGTQRPERRSALRRQAEAVAATAERTIPLPVDRERVDSALARLFNIL